MPQLNLPSEIQYMVNCVKNAAVRLGVLDYVVIVGSVGRCLSHSSQCCNNVGDLDIFIMDRAAELFWYFIHGLLECSKKEKDGKKPEFQPVYDMLVLPILTYRKVEDKVEEVEVVDLRSYWHPCQSEYYAHPLAWTIDCGRHREHDRRVNLDITISCNDVRKIPYNEYFLYLLGKNQPINDKVIKSQHDEFMRHNCRKKDEKDTVMNNRKFSTEIGLYYVDDNRNCR